MMDGPCRPGCSICDNRTPRHLQGPAMSAPHPFPMVVSEEQQMIQLIPDEIATMIGWSPSAITGNTMPPRDPNEDEEDEDEEDDEDDDSVNEPPVVREPDE